MSNKYSPCGRFIEDATGTKWEVEKWHPLESFPWGKMELELGIVFGDPQRDGEGARFYGNKSTLTTHWLARAPLPPVPKVKTQKEKDRDAYRNWMGQAFISADLAEHAWFAALSFARKEAQ